MKANLILLFFMFLLQDACAQKSENYFYYKVQKTDKSFWAICQHFSTNLAEVKKHSNKKEDIIYVDELLKIPAKNLIVHKVNSNDKSLWGISQQYGINYKALLDFNRKTDAIIRTGEYLVFPKVWQKGNRQMKTYAKMYVYNQRTYQVYVSIEQADISRISLYLYLRQEGRWQALDKIEGIEASKAKHYLKREKVFKDLNKDGILDLRFLDRANKRYQKFTLNLKAGRLQKM